MRQAIFYLIMSFMILIVGTTISTFPIIYAYVVNNIDLKDISSSIGTSLFFLAITFIMSVSIFFIAVETFLQNTKNDKN
jgi:hypothetical protein